MSADRSQPAAPTGPIPNYGRSVTLARAAVQDLDAAADLRRMGYHERAAHHDEQARDGLKRALRELGEGA